MQAEVRQSGTRSIASIGLFSALYVIIGGILGTVLGPAFHGIPIHFPRGLLMSGVSANVRKMWSATLMGIVSGIIFVLTVPAPAPYLLLSTAGSGFVYDLVVRARGSYQSVARSTGVVSVASVVSGLAESIIALASLTLIGLISLNGTTFVFVWLTDMVANVILSLAGGLVTIWMVRRKMI